MGMEKEALKKAREYKKYISYNDIIELVENINANYLDGVSIKKLLSDCLNIQIEKLPIQNDTLKKEVSNTFCLMVKNAETRIIAEGIVSMNGRIIKKTIPKINTIAEIFVNEWIDEYAVPATPAISAQPSLQLPENILQALQEKGYIENAAARPLEWLKTKSLLAYFVDVANDKLNLKDSGGRRWIKPFETLFSTYGLIGCMNEYKNKTGQKPKGYKDIDKLFE
jgi:hypothetical protein